MATRITLEELDRADTMREYKGQGDQSHVSKFKYRHTFGLHLLYQHQVDYHNNKINAHLSLERTWATNFWLDTQMGISAKAVN